MSATITIETKVENLWRCPRSGLVAPKADQCAERCFVTPGRIEQHYPVRRVTTVEVAHGHDPDPGSVREHFG